MKIRLEINLNYIKRFFRTYEKKKITRIFKSNTIQLSNKI